MPFISIPWTPALPGSIDAAAQEEAPPSTRRIRTFGLGSFDVKGPEHGQAIFAFLDAWMRSRESPEALYEAHVRSRFGE